jgi:hypothetical protein
MHDRPEFVNRDLDVAQNVAVERKLTLIERISNINAVRKLTILLGLIVVWQAYAVIARPDPLLFPTFTATAQATWNVLADGSLIGKVWISVEVLLMGYAAGLAGAAVMLVLAVSTRIGRDILSTLTAMFQPLPAISLLALAVFLDDHRYRTADQRPDIGRHPAIRTGDHDHFVFAGQRSHDLNDARIESAGKTFQAFEQLDLGLGRQRGDRVIRNVKLAAGRAVFQDRQRAALTNGADGTNRVGSIVQRPQADVVGIGKGGLLAGDGAHTYPLVDVEAARFDDAFVEAPRLGTGILEIEIGVIELMGQDLAESPRQVAFGQRKRSEQQGFGLGQGAVWIH